MKRKDVIIYSLVFALCVGLAAEVVVFQLTGRHLLQPGQTASVQRQQVTCTSTPPLLRAVTSDPQLKVLAEYERVCGSAFTDELMIFTGMPVSAEDATAMADAMAARLKSFEAYGVRPVVIMEPDSEEWGLIDFHEYAKGDFDVWIDSYFKRLKANGVTDKQLGTWIPFPEPQQPFWNNNGNPDDFALSINRHFKTLRTYFPTAQTAVLFDSQVGVAEASQLVAYTRLIEPGLVSIVGLQGFPWQPTEEGDTRRPVMSASAFVPAYMLEEAAKSLDVKQVLINTGTYRHRKLENGGEVAVPAAQRQETLNSIVTEANLLRSAGYQVTVNIFAENKLSAKEGVDWSYWQAGRIDSVAETHAPLFTGFVRQLTSDGIRVSLYDSRQ